ncbi:MAG: serine hydrolase [Rhodothermales bacterium]|nr:serine hydrolase [Rhodothermales bacterium]
MSLRWLPFLLLLIVACSDAPNAVGPDLDQPTAPTYPGAEAAGLDGELIHTLVARADSGDWGEIRSILIERGGTLAVEEYFRGITAEETRPVYSVTKSVTSALVGIALFDGTIASLEDSLGSYFTDYAVPPDAAGITLENLLTMRAGFEWDEWTVPYGGASNSATAIGRSTDAFQYMFDLPITSPPGTRFTYSSGVSMLIGGVLERATGTRTSDFAGSHMFELMGIPQPEWDSNTAGATNTGWGLHMTARQLMAFGRLMENHGFWEGQNIVPRAWIDLSTGQRTTTSNGMAYGFHWWRFRDGDPTISALAQNDVFFAWGYGGQFVIVVPHKDTIIVTTAGNFEGETQTFDMLRRSVFPALR